MRFLKKLWYKYIQGARANNFPISKCGLFGGKLELKVPETLDEALDALGLLLPPDIRECAEEWSEEKFTVRTHHNAGREIRNKWGLWNNSRLSSWFNRRGIKHPDDMSGIILTSYYRRIHNYPTKLEEQIKHYIEY